MFWIISPGFWVAIDVFGNIIRFYLIANDMFVIVLLLYIYHSKFSFRLA